MGCAGARGPGRDPPPCSRAPLPPPRRCRGLRRGTHRCPRSRTEVAALLETGAPRPHGGRLDDALRAAAREARGGRRSPPWARRGREQRRSDRAERRRRRGAPPTRAGHRRGAGPGPRARPGADRPRGRGDERPAGRTLPATAPRPVRRTGAVRARALQRGATNVLRWRMRALRRGLPPRSCGARPSPRRATTSRGRSATATSTARWRSRADGRTRDGSRGDGPRRPRSPPPLPAQMTSRPEEREPRSMFMRNSAFVLCFSCARGCRSGPRAPPGRTSRGGSP